MNRGLLPSPWGRPREETNGTSWMCPPKLKHFFKFCQCTQTVEIHGWSAIGATCKRALIFPISSYFHEQHCDHVSGYGIYGELWYQNLWDVTWWKTYIQWIFPIGSEIGLRRHRGKTRKWPSNMEMVTVLLGIWTAFIHFQIRRGKDPSASVRAAAIPLISSMGQVRLVGIILWGPRIEEGDPANQRVHRCLMFFFCAWLSNCLAPRFDEVWCISQFGTYTTSFVYEEDWKLSFHRKYGACCSDSDFIWTLIRTLI